MSAAAPNQFDLLRQRRFAPFFWTQFLGAGNDNLFKFAFTVLVTYQLEVAWLPPKLAGLAIGALFILPFVLFSATSGQIADKYEKSRVMRWVKGLEIAIMALAAWGFLAAQVPVLLGCVFLMGLHSTLFGPVKFAYLPQHLDARELIGGNALVEMGTFVAILLGQVTGGLLVALPQIGPQAVAVACLGVALLGRATVQSVPLSPSTEAGLRINWNPITETWRNLSVARNDRVVFRSLLGISWMWFFGAVFLSQFPSFAKEVLFGNEQVASGLLVVFSVGVGLGALLCERLGRGQLELGLVPLGAVGMSLFSIDLYFASRSLPPSALMSVSEFLSRPAHWRVMADLGLMSLFTGLYSVPMYALIQWRSPSTHRARIIAANNILNALFMIVSALGAGALLSAGWTIPEVFLATGLLNVVVALYVFLTVPQYLLRGLAFAATRLVYRFEVEDPATLPATGAALWVARHSQDTDLLLLLSGSAQPIRFILDRGVVLRPFWAWLLQRAGMLVDAQQARSEVAQSLADGEILCLVIGATAVPDPSGQTLQACCAALAEADAVPVLPVALASHDGPGGGAGGEGTPAMPRPRRWFSRVRLVTGPAIPRVGVSPAALHKHVAQLASVRP